MALYLLFENLDLGIIIKQVAAVEPDPGSHRLIVTAKDIPQLPLSHLRLHLGESEGAPLVSPAFCGDYKVPAEFTPWSNGQPITTTSTFAIVSGQNGAPCPVEGGDSQPSGQGGCGSCQSTPTSPSSAAPPNGSGPSGPAKAHKRHCPKGRHRMRRKGKVRCVKNGHKKRHSGSLTN